MMSQLNLDAKLFDALYLLVYNDLPEKSECMADNAAIAPSVSSSHLNLESYHGGFPMIDANQSILRKAPCELNMLDADNRYELPPNNGRDFSIKECCTYKKFQGDL
jgi:hypothetical protein